MSAKNIEGLYTVQFGVNTGTFTLSDSSRDESQGATDQDLTVTLLGGKYGGESIYFDFEKNFKILRARIDAVGAPGLQRPYQAGATGLAAALNINIVAANGNDDPAGGLRLRLPNWGAWYDINAKIKPYETTPAPVWTYPDNIKPVKLRLAGTGTYFAYDGYNLSADYVGQDWRPVVTLEIDTAGVYNYGLVLI